MAPAYVKNYNIIKQTKAFLELSYLIWKKKWVNWFVLTVKSQVQQTSGPTIFTITDESSITWVAAFDEAGSEHILILMLEICCRSFKSEINQHGIQTSN